MTEPLSIPNPPDSLPDQPAVSALGKPAPADVAPLRHPILLQLTDADFPRYWKSGSLKYDDFAPLAEGGTCVLQTCLDKNLNRVVVYKSLREHLVDEPTEVARFIREARVTAMIPHPGTVPLYELGRDREGHPYFTMKKLEGRDLRSILAALSAQDHATEEAYPLARLIDVIISACQTLGSAHQQGVVHRDIKPANILVGEFGEVTVLDWGLAQVKGEPSDAERELPTGREAIALELTQPGRRFGTPLYMSPEQARGDATDERTDIHAMGIVLFETLTGQPLIFGQDIEEVLQQVLERPTPRPRDVAPRRIVPPTLEAICLKCLEKNPADRYLDLLSLLVDLQDFRDRERLIQPAPFRPSEVHRLRTRRQEQALFAILGLAAGSLGTALLMLLS